MFLTISPGKKLKKRLEVLEKRASSSSISPEPSLSTSSADASRQQSDLVSSQPRRSEYPSTQYSFNSLAARDSLPSYSKPRSPSPSVYGSNGYSSSEYSTSQTSYSSYPLQSADIPFYPSSYLPSYSASGPQSDEAARPSYSDDLHSFNLDYPTTQGNLELPQPSSLTTRRSWHPENALPQVMLPPAPPTPSIVSSGANGAGVSHAASSAHGRSYSYAYGTPAPSAPPASQEPRYFPS